MPEDATPQTTSQDDPILTVGVGASAGGLEAFLDLLEGLPEDPNLALVYVQHLDPERESGIADRVRGASDLVVTQAEDQDRLERGHLYVIPPDVEPHVEGGLLHFQPLERSPAGRRTVDAFLTSLAEDRGSRSAGVVLSGTLSDGTEGLRAIQQAGGFTFAQDPETAVYPDMPKSAIDARVADQVLSPKSIAQELARLASDLPASVPATATETDEGTLPVDEDTLQRIFKAVRSHGGLDLTHYKRGTIQRRLERRMLAAGTADPKEYADRLVEDPSEAEALVEEVLIHVTQFFRDPEFYEALKEHVFPRLVEGREPEETIRIWVPGCATGEEVYSLAVALSAAMDQQWETFPLQIFGSDVSSTAVETARAGIYPASIADDVPEPLLKRYFERTESGYEVSKSIRGMCVFAEHDLTRDPPFGNIDLISCRNVLIYLDRPLQKRVVSMLHYALLPDGVLAVGSSEALSRFDHLFRRDTASHQIYRKKEVTPSPIHDFAAPTSAGTTQTPDKGADAVVTAEEMEQEADRVLRERYAPPAVVVNPDLEIMAFRGNTEPYLEHPTGEASLNLLRMARKGLTAELQSAVREARDEDAPVKRQGVRTRVRGDVREVGFEVLPLKRSGSRPHFLVTFDDGREEDREPRRSRPGLLTRAWQRLFAPGEASPPPEEVERLEREIESMEEYVRTLTEEYEAAMEELRSANEEALSTNEELQSTNEELQTAKEELQSTNEELQTLNDDLQERNRQVQKINDDLVNLLESVDLPILMLAPDLHIRRVTPALEDLMNIIPTDLGRPLTDIRLPFDVEPLRETILDVLDTAQTRNLELEHEEGASYRVEVSPYRTSDHRIDGTVLVFLRTDPPEG